MLRSAYQREPIRSRRRCSAHRRRLSLGLFLLIVPLTILPLLACGITEPGNPDPGDGGHGGPDPGNLKVLFIGSSYLGVNDMPRLFKDMAEAAGKSVFVGEMVQAGYYLDFFAQDAITARAIQDREWDFVIFSGGCQTAAYPDTHHLIMPGGGRHDPGPALEKLAAKVREHSPDAVPVYMMPWAFEDGMTWIPGQIDDYFAMQESIRENALSWAQSLDLVVGPVGMAWKRVMEGGVPTHYLHLNDWNHPSRRGTFLSAATLFSTIFQESTEDLDFNWGLTSLEGEAFRATASEVVLDSLSLWNITSG